MPPQTNVTVCSRLIILALTVAAIFAAGRPAAGAQLSTPLPRGVFAYWQGKKAPAAAAQANPKEKKGKKQNAADLQQFEVQGAAQAVGAAGEQLGQARKNAAEATKDLDKIADDLEKSQPESSPFALAKARLEIAKKAYQKAVDHMTQSPEYQAIGDATAGDAVERADQRARLLAADEQVSLAKTELSTARSEYHSLREKLLHNDADWTAANEKAKGLRKETEQAEAAVRKATNERISANTKLRQAQQDEANKRQAELNQKQADAAAKQQRDAQQKQAQQNAKLRQQQLKYGQR